MFVFQWRGCGGGLVGKFTSCDELVVARWPSWKGAIHLQPSSSTVRICAFVHLRTNHCCPNHLPYTYPVAMGIPGTSDSKMTWVMYLNREYFCFILVVDLFKGQRNLVYHNKEGHKLKGLWSASCPQIKRRTYWWQKWNTRPLNTWFSWCWRETLTQNFLYISILWFEKCLFCFCFSLHNLCPCFLQGHSHSSIQPRSSKWQYSISDNILYLGIYLKNISTAVLTVRSLRLRVYHTPCRCQ